jgi:hypothetical protein
VQAIFIERIMFYFSLLCFAVLIVGCGGSDTVNAEIEQAEIDVAVAGTCTLGCDPVTAGQAACGTNGDGECAGSINNCGGANCSCKDITKSDGEGSVCLCTKFRGAS